MCTATLFVTAQSRKLRKRPSVGEQFNRLWFIQRADCRSAERKENGGDSANIHWPVNGWMTRGSVRTLECYWSVKGNE